MFQLRRILVPLDFSECSERALAAALGFAVRFDSAVTLLHVTPRPGSRTYGDHARTADEIASIETNERALLNAYIKVAEVVSQHTGLAGLPPDRRTLLVRGGDPAEEIVRAAEEAQVDMVIMGTHGRTTIRDFFVGSTAERVVQRASCAVLAVKPEGYPFLRD